VGVADPPRQVTTSVLPHRQGVSCKVAAHLELKTPESVWKQTSASVADGTTWLQVLPSGRAPAKSVAAPVVPSHVPPSCAGSRQPLACAHEPQLGLIAFSTPRVVWTAETHWPVVSHVAPAAQVPQLTTPPQLSMPAPQTLVPQSFPVTTQPLELELLEDELEELEELELLEEDEELELLLELDELELLLDDDELELELLLELLELELLDELEELELPEPLGLSQVTLTIAPPPVHPALLADEAPTATVTAPGLVHVKTLFAPVVLAKVPAPSPAADHESVAPGVPPLALSAIDPPTSTFEGSAERLPTTGHAAPASASVTEASTKTEPASTKFVAAAAGVHTRSMPTAVVIPATTEKEAAAPVQGVPSSVVALRAIV
jgi:hypothetical protein